MYFIVRDRDTQKLDLSVVWNWRERCWAWDTDKCYDRDGGWAYADRHTAVRRAKALRQAKQHWVYRNTSGVAIKNIRVVDENGLEVALDN